MFERRRKLCKLKEPVKKSMTILPSLLSDEGAFDEERLQEDDQAIRDMEGNTSKITRIIMARKGKCLVSGARMLADGTAAKKVLRTQ